MSDDNMITSSHLIHKELFPAGIFQTFSIHTDDDDDDQTTRTVQTTGSSHVNVEEEEERQDVTSLLVSDILSTVVKERNHPDEKNRKESRSSGEVEKDTASTPNATQCSTDDEEEEEEGRKKKNSAGENNTSRLSPIPLDDAIQLLESTLTTIKTTTQKEKEGCEIEEEGEKLKLEEIKEVKKQIMMASIITPKTVVEVRFFVAVIKEYERKRRYQVEVLFLAYCLQEGALTKLQGVVEREKERGQKLKALIDNLETELQQLRKWSVEEEEEKGKGGKGNPGQKNFFPVFLYEIIQRFYQPAVEMQQLHREAFEANYVPSSILFSLDDHSQRCGENNVDNEDAEETTTDRNKKKTRGNLQGKSNHGEKCNNDLCNDDNDDEGSAERLSFLDFCRRCFFGGSHDDDIEQFVTATDLLLRELDQHWRYAAGTLCSVAVDSLGNTGLHLACQGNHEDVVMYLLHHTTIPIDGANYWRSEERIVSSSSQGYVELLKEFLVASRLSSEVDNEGGGLEGEKGVVEQKSQKGEIEREEMRIAMRKKEETGWRAGRLAVLYQLFRNRGYPPIYYAALRKNKTVFLELLKRMPLRSIFPEKVWNQFQMHQEQQPQSVAEMTKNVASLSVMLVLGRYGPRGATLLHCVSEIDDTPEAWYVGQFISAGCDVRVPSLLSNEEVKWFGGKSDGVTSSSSSSSSSSCYTDLLAKQSTRRWPSALYLNQYLLEMTIQDSKRLWKTEEAVVWQMQGMAVILLHNILQLCLHHAEDAFKIQQKGKELKIDDAGIMSLLDKKLCSLRGGGGDHKMEVNCSTEVLEVSKMFKPTEIAQKQEKIWKAVIQDLV